MKKIKNVLIVLLLILAIAFTCVMVFPMDNFIAQQALKLHGNKVATKFASTETHYYYDRLNEDERNAYLLIEAEIEDFPEHILIPDLTNDELENVFEAISYDNPEFFFLGNKCNLTSIGSLNYFVPQYILTEEEYEKRMKLVLDASDKIIKEISKDKIVKSSENIEDKEYRQELLAHDYVTRNCEYYDGHSSMIYTIYGALIEGKANCEGYSRTIQFLLSRMGIENYLVTGESLTTDGERLGHMWNIVKIGGKLYNLDSTWDDYSTESSIKLPDNSPSHMYFNISSDRLSTTHEIDDKEMWEGCTFDDSSYFKKEGLYFDKCDREMENALRTKISRSLMNGDCSVEFAFSNKEAYERSISYFVDGNRMYVILRAINKVVPNDFQVDSKQIQYAGSDDKLTMRFFFIR